MLATSTRKSTSLLAAAAFFTVAVLLHNGDHLRRGADSVASDVFWVGSLSILLEVGVVVLIALRHRLAPLAAVSTGFGLAAGYVLVHVLPGRSWLSDPLFEGGASPLSQGAASLEIVAAIALGVAGWLAVRELGGLAEATTPQDDGAIPPGTALRHPLVATMAIGNALVFGLSILTR